MTETNAIILNVDDREASRYTKSRHLKQFGYQVVEAENGAEALRVVEEIRPSVVLLDVRLPDINGVEVCRVIKANWPEVMVLQTSATFTNVEDRIRGLNGGADSYLIQPAEQEELAAAVEALLRIRRAEDNLRALNDELEKRVQERTAVLEAVNRKLEKEIAQRETAEAALVQAQKMEAVGRLTGGLAHDFNNLLTAIVGNLDLIRRHSGEPRTLRLAENALKAANRGSKLTAQLLAFSRTQKLVAKPVNINEVIVGMSEMLAQTLGPTIRIQTELDAAAGLANTDQNQIEVAILNLALNARDAMPNGGALTIRTAGADKPVTGDDLAAGRYVTVTVADTGEGMTAETQNKAFDPFFTTKAAGKGTGLGLAQVYGISRQCGGTARIASKPGDGTEVTIWLPHVDGSAAPMADDAPLHGGESPGGKVLLIDDDPDVRETLSEVLTELGYQLSIAEDGKAGIALLDDDPDIVILDFAMPELNGAEVSTLIRARRPDLPILIVSGYADTEALAAAVGDAPILHKPFGRSELAEALRRVKLRPGEM